MVATNWNLPPWSTKFLTISKVFIDPVWYFFIFWFPKYLADVHHFSLKEIGWKGWIPYFTAALGNFAGGLLTAQLIGRGVPVPRARKARSGDATQMPQAEHTHPHLLIPHMLRCAG